MKFILILLVFILLPLYAAAQNPIGDTIDCTDIRIDYIDDPNLTRDERLILMDKALTEALNRFEHCQQQKAMGGAADSGSRESAVNHAGSGVQGTKGAANMAQGSSGETGGEAAALSGGMESAASMSMSGSEPAPFETVSPEAAEQDSQTRGSAGTQKATGGKIQGSEAEAKSKGGIKTNSSGAMKNGKIPEDIPDAKNDDALAAQIRYAAENEKDPEKRKQLWNEYRKYKGLPQI